MAQADIATTKLIAHRLKGSAANCGWFELANCCSRIEVAAHDSAQASHAMRELEELLLDAS
jgi:HPt (histidine-containing phosphotransfer) domain-containing protein